MEDTASQLFHFIDCSSAAVKEENRQNVDLDEKNITIVYDEIGVDSLRSGKSIVGGLDNLILNRKERENKVKQLTQITERCASLINSEETKDLGLSKTNFEHFNDVNANTFTKSVCGHLLKRYHSVTEEPDSLKQDNSTETPSKVTERNFLDHVTDSLSQRMLIIEYKELKTKNKYLKLRSKLLQEAVEFMASIIPKSFKEPKLTSQMKTHPYTTMSVTKSEFASKLKTYISATNTLIESEHMNKINLHEKKTDEKKRIETTKINLQEQQTDEKRINTTKLNLQEQKTNKEYIIRKTSIDIQEQNPYKMRRSLNNIASRKSRQKKKEFHRMLYVECKELNTKNKYLREKFSMLEKVFQKVIQYRNNLDVKFLNLEA